MRSEVETMAQTLIGRKRIRRFFGKIKATLEKVGAKVELK